MKDTQALMDKTSKEGLSDLDVLRLLHSNSGLVRVNMLMNVANCKLSEPDLIADEIYKISDINNGGSFVFMGIVNQRLLSDIALFFINTPHSLCLYNKILTLLSEYERNYLVEYIENNE